MIFENKYSCTLVISINDPMIGVNVKLVTSKLLFSIYFQVKLTHKIFQNPENIVKIIF
jgi:hypothetical protein